MILSLGAAFSQSLGPNGATSTPFKPILIVFEGLFRPTWARARPGPGSGQARPGLGLGQAVFPVLKDAFLVF